MHCASVELWGAAWAGAAAGMVIMLLIMVGIKK